MFRTAVTNRQSVRFGALARTVVVLVAVALPAGAQIQPGVAVTPGAGYQPYGYTNPGASQYNRYGSTYPGSTGYNRYGSTYPGASQFNRYGSTYPGSSQYNRYGSTYPGSSQFNRYGSTYPGSSQFNRYGNTNPGSSQFNQFGSNQRYRDPTTGQFTNRTNTTRDRYGRTPRAGRETPGRPGATPGVSPGASPGAGQTGKPVTTVRGQPRAPAKASGGSAGSGVTAEMTFKPTPDIAVLYMTPMQAVLEVGKEFETRVSLSNPEEKECIEIEVVLRYNPMVIEPIRLDDDKIRPLLDGDAEAVVYSEAGLLAYTARLSAPARAQAADIFTVRWNTLTTSQHTEISFSGGRGHSTQFLNASGEDILGGTGNDGALDMSLQIYSPAELADGPPIGEQLFAGYNDGARSGVRLRLVTNKREIPANEDFYVGVWYENPKMVDCTKLRFKIRFDPRVLEVMDDDRDNWIASGVNVFDGDFHEMFPFDVHIANSVTNQTGLIEYAVACTRQRALPEQGYVARVRFRPKALARSTPIEFEFGANDDPLRTQVTFLGADVLGTTDDPNDGVENLAVTILKPELPKMLTVE